MRRLHRQRGRLAPGPSFPPTRVKEVGAAVVVADLLTEMCRSPRSVGSIGPFGFRIGEYGIPGLSPSATIIGDAKGGLSLVLGGRSVPSDGLAVCASLRGVGVIGGECTGDGLEPGSLVGGGVAHSSPCPVA